MAIHQDKNITNRIAKLEKELTAKKRTLEIEEAVERVSAVAMRMKKPGDLLKVCESVFKELKALGFTSVELRNAQIAINNDEKGFYYGYQYSDYIGGEATEVPYNVHPVVKKLHDKMKRSNNAFADIEIKGKELKDWKNFVNSFPQKHDKKLNAASELHYYFYSVGIGALGISSFQPLPKEKLDILQRLRNVFNLSYQRYTDIALAEAQAREAEIELALERVRAKTMAMQKSDELKETTLVLFQQFKALGATTAQVSICIFDEKTIKGEMFVTLQGEKIDRSFLMDLHEESFVMNKAKKAFLARQKTFSSTITGKELQNYNHWRNLLIGKKGWDESAAARKQSWYVNAVFFSRGMMGISSELPPSDEALKLLERFGNVFDLTFTRFLDLQKAEAQAREAQIEAALEKIRSTSLAMHSSTELKEVIAVTFEKLNELNVLHGTVGIQLFDWGKMNAFMWVGNNIQEPQMVNLPYDKKMMNDDSLLKDEWQAMKEGVDLINKVYSFKQKNRFFNYIFSHNDLIQIPESARELLLQMKNHVVCLFTEKNSALFVDSFKGELFSTDDQKVVKRTAKVFEQAYIRFLDLQKAEAQAREAQIQLSLERVRAKAMAMYHSDELSDVLSVLFEQFDVLGINPNHAILSLVDLEKNSVVFRLTGKAGKRVTAQQVVDLTAMDMWMEMVERWKKDGPDVINLIHYPKEVLPQVWEIFAPVINAIPEDARIKVEDFPDGMYNTEAYCQFGYIGFCHTRFATEEEKNILTRFATEFGRLYQRFLDLQKAEEQAREAHIEAGLERVRSRAMAMQTSEELNALIGTVFTELTKLDLVLTRCVIWVFDPATDSPRWWMANSEEPSNPMNFLIKYHEHPAYLTFLQEWKKQNVKFVYDLKGQDKISWDDILFNETELVNLPDVVKNGMRAPERVLLSASFNNFGGINVASLEPLSDEHFDILLRFAKVFDLTYTRFNDLKQAEAQAREAEIQLALERVRARTMAMHKSEELAEVAAVLFQQLNGLGNSTERINIGIVNEEKGIIEYWATDQNGHQIDHRFNATIKEPTTIAKVYAGWKENKKSMVVDLTGDELKEWMHYLLKELKMPFREELIHDRRVHTVAFFSHGMLLISTPEPVPQQETINLLERFANVFEQTYTRFLDLQKAEAQTREAQIEVALEKVRSRSLAMHKAEELGEVATVVFEKLRELGMPVTDGVAIVTHIEGSKDQVEWMENPGMPSAMRFFQPYYEHPILADYWNAKNEGLDFIAPKYTAEQSRSFFNHIFEDTDYKYTPQEIKDYCLAAETYSYFAAFQKNSSIFINDFSGRILTELEIDIVKRFSKVFEQAYVRFLDLQRSEAQAREAQIEAALERVRSRTMAMQRSEELADVATVLFQQVKALGVPQWACGFAIFEIGDKEFTWYPGGPDGEILTPCKIPLTEHPVFISFNESRKRGDELFIYEKAGEIQKDHYRYMLSLPVLGEFLQSRLDAGIEFPAFQIDHIANFSHGNLVFITYEHFPEMHDIFKRFAKVFEQTYTRFLDLQKAEAQAREAQIETALERVRSRTMAMYQTSELQEVIHTVHKELLNLNLSIDGGSFVVINDDVGPELRCWGSGGTANTSEEVRVPHFNMPFCTDLMKGIRGGPGFFTEEFSQKEKKEYFTKLFEHKPWSDLSSEQKKETLSSMGGYTRSVAVSEHTSIFIINHHGRKFTAAENDILKRFAKVFEQTYTRFLDLQKAEAQARESQIQLALERVRARTMAMQKSEELKDAAALLFQQVKALGVPAYSCGYNIWENDEKTFTSWMSTQDGSDFNAVHNIPLTEDANFIRFAESRQKGEQFFVLELRGQRMQEHYEYLKTIPAFKAYFDYAVSVGFDLPETQIHHIANFSQGNLLFITLESCPEFHEVFKRFAAVFEQTYTRFLDLKKAEEQARESQIQLALERVRARTMAMHRSEELAETAQVVFQQLKELGAIPDRIAIGVVNEVAGVVNFWTTDQTGSHIDNNFKGRLNERTVMSKAYQAWKDHRKSLIVDLHDDDVTEWIKFAREEMGIFIKDEFIKNRRVHSFAFFSHGWILVTTHEPQSAETIQILERFASVFNLTYRRFLDLEKAEGQAREAKIEAALERVRSKAMAMHKSEDLNPAVATMFDELEKLDLGMLRCGIGIINKEKRSTDVWLTSKSEGETTVQISGDESMDLHPLLQGAFEAWVRHEDFSYVLEGEDMIKYYQTSGMGNVRLPESQLILSDEQLHKQYYHLATFQEGALFAFRNTEFPGEAKMIMKRFAGVFNLTYKRFLDLQKAEAQAREAQIEAALEKVRSRSLAMHKSDELQEVVNTVFERLTDLNVQMDSCNIAIFKESTRDFDYWIASPVQKRSAVFHVPYMDLYLTKDLIAARESGTDFFTKAYSFEEKNEWFAYAYEHSDFKLLPDERKKFLAEAKGISFSIAFSKNTAVQINNFSAGLPSESETDILKRFSKVFEQAYIRFLDLEKAEAQAREAQIEAALEKVRSRSLAMHKSEELQEVVNTVFERLKELNIEMDSANIAIFKEGAKDFDYWIASPFQKRSASFHMPYIDLSLTKDIVAARESGIEYSATSYPFEIKNEWFDFAFKNTDFKFLEEERKQFILNSPGITIGIAFSKHTGIQVNRYSSKLLAEGEIEILKRFSKVFEQAYIRFLDLKKAEAQAREAQIEASLERVRSKTMAMHNSNDVGETVTAMFAEFVNLGILTNRCGIVIFDDNYSAEVWTARTVAEGKATLIIGKLNLKIYDLLSSAYESWKDKKPIYQYELQGDDLVRHYEAIKRSEYYPIEFDMNALPQKEFHTEFFFPEGAVFAFTAEPISDEHSKIMRRFAGVFGQTYRRYLDLQKAEAQAKEAQIEAGLERVRARTMAMHSSDDVSAATATMFTELEKLGIQNLRGGITIIKPDHMQEVWSVTNMPDGKTIKAIGVFDMRLHALWQELLKAREDNEDYNYYWLAGKDKEEYIAILNATPNYLAQPIKEFPDVHVQSYFFGEGAVWTNSLQPHSEDDKQIMKRFASVFSLTFRRYQDLKKAEAQAREAQIEAGLERVRARTMAMHNSEDVSIATATMFIELEKLGIENFRGGILNIRENRTMDVWSVNKSADSDPNDPVGRGNTIRAAGEWDMMLHPWWRELYNGWKNKDEFLYYFLTGKEKDNYIKLLDARRDYLPQGIQSLPDSHIQGYYFGEGAVWTFSLQPHSEEHKQIMKRFASVFSLTFRRYQDLKKAEAQAREATIEAALEKVRGKAMAMHNSNDLSVTTSLIIGELRKLGITPIRCGVGIINKETHKAQLYTATTSAEGDSLSVVGWVLLKGHPVLENIYQKFVEGEDYFPELTGDSLQSYYKQLLAGLSVPLPDFKDEQKHYGHFFSVSVGCLYAWSDIKYNDDEIKILKRFASIIDLTFRRYFELQKSEENAKEAVKQAALDRIRADIASMRTVGDLDRITPLIWNELTILGIPFIRCGVFIMDDSLQFIHTFLSTPDGKAIAAFHLPYDTPGSISKVIDNWRHKKIYMDHWGEEEFTQFADILMRQGALASRELYLKTIPRGGFHLHFLPFLQGMLYVGNTTQLGEEEIELIQHVADAFSTAYARYEDFNRLEAAKQQVENTLTDLKQAQQQLVQSEKMASLGELTAGIAHEIQNPLNFVNNFSDVSNELLEEMKNELATGNTKQAIEIANDVIDNLDKILHHGKRADAIVKGMLQHSRTSSGQKEMTDINVLADEYLRLAYHGLRAKDKSFNAKFETHFDDNIGKVNIIPQEIGRVILNLINNAFYTVTEKKKHVVEGFEPTVTVTTLRDNGRIEIKVKDNGNGIPQKNLDKIFQPFFTTKPTGQGTGLGLSLAYDIVTKGHGGELKVETKEGEGSEFVIQLPS